MHGIAFVTALVACNTSKPSGDKGKDPTETDVPDTDTTPDTDTEVPAATGDTSVPTLETAATGDTGPACDDTVERMVRICWEPGPNLASATDGVLMLADVYGAWEYAPMVYGPFTELCADRLDLTGSIVRVQATYTDLDPNEVPQDFAGQWWAIAHWPNGVRAEGTWWADNVEVPVYIVGYDGEIVIPSCQ